MSDDVVIRELTDLLCTKMKADAAAALNGDGTCSLKAMSMSCFASEACSQNRHSTMNLDLLMMHPYKFVALDEKTGEFIGCVSGKHGSHDDTCSSYFPSCSMCDKDIVLYNLCVSQSQRGRGAGRKLVGAILNTASSPDHVYLLVSRLNLKEQDPERLKVYTDRISRLLSLYDRLEFDVINECEKCYLLKHR